MKSTFAAFLISAICTVTSLSASAADFVCGIPSGSCVSTDAWLPVCKILGRFDLTI